MAGGNATNSAVGIGASAGVAPDTAGPNLLHFEVVSAAAVRVGIVAGIMPSATHTNLEYRSSRMSPARASHDDRRDRAAAIGKLGQR